MDWGSDSLSQISLLPSEYRSFADKKRKKSLIFIISTVTISVLLISYIMLSLLNIISIGELNSLNMEKAQLETMTNTYGKYSDVYNAVKGYEQLLDSANIHYFNWDIVLNKFAETVPHGMWFDSIKLEYDGKKGSCVIKGKLNNKRIMAEWLADIEKTEILKNVVCKYLQDIVENGETIVVYEITAEVDMGKIKTGKRVE